MSTLILFVFLGAAALAVPIAHAILLAALAAAASTDRVPLDLLVQQMVAQVQSFPLIAIPFFMLTGSLMMGGKLGQAIVGVLTALTALAVQERSTLFERLAELTPKAAKVLPPSRET